MKITKVDAATALAEAQKCLDLINRDYRGNIRFDACYRLSARSINVKLGVHDSGKYGARCSASGRKLPCASWEAYRDWLRAFLRVFPDATVRTALVTYRGLDAFERDHEATSKRNVGSMIAPVYIRETTL